eukprot:m.145871 g.145871  ORF g.145871 m.145871 type:complete len:364 (-) comp16225_c0_seq2:24-1115(-)
MAVVKAAKLILALCALCVAADTSYDFTEFEDNFIHQWLDLFTINAANGTYSFLAKSSQAGVYGSADVLHILFVLDQFNLTNDGKRAAAQVINGYQNTSGFFDLQAAEQHTGFQPWHATGYVNAALRLFDARSEYNNSVYRELIASPNDWQSTVDVLLNATDGCSSIWSCGHKLAAMVAVLSMEGALQDVPQANAFVDWWNQYLNSRVDRNTGQWLVNPVWAPPAKEGLGGAFHLYFVYTWLQMPWPFPNASMTTAASMQHDGLWGGPTPSYIDIDGMYQVVRPAMALGTPEAEALASQACQQYLPVLHKALTSISTVLGPQLATNTHTLPALVGGVAECGKWFPDMVATRRPWKQCLDYAPFI